MVLCTILLGAKKISLKKTEEIEVLKNEQLLIAIFVVRFFLQYSVTELQFSPFFIL